MSTGFCKNFSVHQRSFGILNLKIAHHLITRYLVAGKNPNCARKGCYTVAKSFTGSRTGAESRVCKKIVNTLGLQSSLFV